MAKPHPAPNTPHRIHAVSALALALAMGAPVAAHAQTTAPATAPAADAPAPPPATPGQPSSAAPGDSPAGAAPAPAATPAPGATTSGAAPAAPPSAAAPTPAAASSGPKIDPTTGEPYKEPQSTIDPSTGMLVDSVTQLPRPRPPVVDAATGTVRPDAPRFDAALGRLVDRATGKPIEGAPAIDAATGALADPATGQPDPASPVVDPASGELLPMSRLVDPATGALVDPFTGTALPPSPVYDPATQQPVGAGPIVDPVTGLNVPLPGEEAATTEESPYGPKALWQHGGIVARAVLLTMLAMFSATWYIIFTKFFEQSRLLAQARRLGRFWAAPSVPAGVETLPPRSPFRAIASLADRDSWVEPEGLGGRIDRDARTSIDLGRTLDYLSARLQSGMAVLATVGSTAPFVGLFGTVIGIYRALVAIGVSGEPSIDKVAGPVGEALIMTALGLFVAVPAVFLYNVLGRRNKVVMDNARAFAADVGALIDSDTTGGPYRETRDGDVRRAYAR